MRFSNTNIVANFAVEIRQAMVRVRDAFQVIIPALHLSRHEALGAGDFDSGFDRMSRRHLQTVGLGMCWLSYWAGAMGFGLRKPALKPAPCPKPCQDVARR